MDVAIFKASRIRLIVWIAIPPLLITSVGLSLFALKQKAQWQLQQTQALSDVLPSVIEARKDIEKLFEELGLSKENRIASEDELISLLQEKARSRDMGFPNIQVIRNDKIQGSNVPVLSAVVESSGDIKAFQFYLNDIKSAQPLLNVSSITLKQKAGRGRGDLPTFDLRVVFDLLLVDDVLKSGGSL